MGPTGPIPIRIKSEILRPYLALIRCTGQREVMAMLVVEDAEAEKRRRKDELLRRLGRVLETAEPTAMDIVEELVEAAETNEEARRKRAAGTADLEGDASLACFMAGSVDEDGANVKAADREACGEKVRELQRKSRIQAKFWGRELSVLEFLTQDSD